MTYQDTQETLFFGALGSVIRQGLFFDAWKDGFWIGRYTSIDDATEELVWREKIKIA